MRELPTVEDCQFKTQGFWTSSLEPVLNWKPCDCREAALGFALLVLTVWHCREAAPGPR
jgi:hypothetical protein